MFLHFGAKEGTGMAYVFFWVSFNLLPPSNLLYCETVLRGRYLGCISTFSEWILLGSSHFLAHSLFYLAKPEIEAG